MVDTIADDIFVKVIVAEKIFDILVGIKILLYSIVGTYIVYRAIRGKRKVKE